jgi:hypothetical protein
METENQAKEILDYCIQYLTGNNELKEKDYKNPKKLYKEMLKEICFMLEND